jgi:transcriptional regulator with XRE-family HTH domain
MMKPDKNYEPFGQVVKKHREIRSWSQSKLAQKSGLSLGQIKAIETRVSSRPSHEAVVRLAKAFNITESELYPIEGLNKDSNPYKHDDFEELLTRLRLAQPLQIPVYPNFKVHAGAVHAEPVDYVYVQRITTAPENIAAFRVTGECMEPKIENGDIVIVNTERSPEAGNHVIRIEVRRHALYLGSAGRPVAETRLQFR